MSTTDYVQTYNQGYRDGEKAQRERQASVARLQAPVGYVGHPDVLEHVAAQGRHMTILMRENESNCGIPLYAEPVFTTPEFRWKLLNSLECTAKWLEAGCDPKEAAGELRLNIAALRGVGVSRV